MGGCAGKQKVDRSAAYKKPQQITSSLKQPAAAAEVIQQDRINAAAAAAAAAQPLAQATNGNPHHHQQQQLLSQRFEYSIPVDLAARIDFIVSSVLTEVLCTYRSDRNTLERIALECEVFEAPAEAMNRIRQEIQSLYNAAPGAIAAAAAAGAQQSKSQTRLIDLTKVTVSPEQTLTLIEEYLIHTDNRRDILTASADHIQQILQLSLQILHIGFTVLKLEATQIIWWQHLNPLYPLEGIIPELEVLLSKCKNQKHIESEKKEVIMNEIINNYTEQLYGQILNVEYPAEELKQQPNITARTSRTARTDYGENCREEDDADEHNVTFNYSIDYVRRPQQQQQLQQHMQHLLDSFA